MLGRKQQHAKNQTLGELIDHTLNIWCITMIILVICHIDDTQQGGGTALHFAVISDHCDCAQVLIQAGADIDMTDYVGAIDVQTVYLSSLSYS